MVNQPPSIYLAAPLFTQAERDFNAQLAGRLRAAGHTIFLPQEEGQPLKDTQQLFKHSLKGLNQAHLILAILDGSDADSGTCFEVGYAYAKGLPIIGLRTDFRGTGDQWGLNLMLLHSCSHLIINQLNLPRYIPHHITIISQSEDYFPILLKVLE